MENKKDNLYIIKVYNKHGNSIFKIGYSSNLENRLRTYYYHNPLIALVGTYYKDNAKKLEKEIHSKIRAKYLDEWYDIEKLQEVLDLVKGESYDELNYRIQYCSEGIIYTGKKEFDRIMPLIKSKEYFIFCKLADRLNEKNVIRGFNEYTPISVIENILDTDRKDISKIILRLKELNLLKEYKDEWYLNPYMQHKSDFVPYYVYEMFETK